MRFFVLLFPSLSSFFLLTYLKKFEEAILSPVIVKEEELGLHVSRTFLVNFQSCDEIRQIGKRILSTGDGTFCFFLF